MHRDTLDEGGGHLHQPAQDGLDPAILHVLVELADSLGLVREVGESEADWIHVPRKTLGLEGRNHVAGGRAGGVHQLLQCRR